jgi:hypothetical protein
MKKYVITDEEVAAVLGDLQELGDMREPGIPRSEWVDRLIITKCPGLPLDEVLEVAAEGAEDPLATIHALLRGLIIRHAEDDTTTSALVAIAELHLPVLVRRLPT